MLESTYSSTSMTLAMTLPVLVSDGQQRTTLSCTADHYQLNFCSAAGLYIQPRCVDCASIEQTNTASSCCRLMIRLAAGLATPKNTDGCSLKPSILTQLTFQVALVFIVKELGVVHKHDKGRRLYACLRHR